MVRRKRVRRQGSGLYGIRVAFYGILFALMLVAVFFGTLLFMSEALKWLSTLVK